MPTSQTKISQIPKCRKNAESNTTNFLNKTSQKHSTDFYNCRNKIATTFGMAQFSEFCPLPE